jgi:hypothetical protein
MLAECSIALKEWSVLCAALAQGRYLLLLRKGGLAEGPRGFTVEHPEFWLLPTRFHQSADELAPELTPLLAEVAAVLPPAGSLGLDLYAEVSDLFRIEREDDLTRLEGRHGLSPQTVHERFHYRRPGLSLLVLRVYRRPAPWMIPDRPEYAGCHSWVPLDRPLATAGVVPVLSDAEFERRRTELADALSGLPHQSPVRQGEGP